MNRAGRAPSLSPRLRAALVLSDRARRRTAGRFDPRVLLDMERLGFAGASLEHADVRQARLRPSPADRVLLGCAADGFRLPVPVDLGGVGKGLALRWAAAAAAVELDGPFLLDAGGDIVTGGAPPGDWSIGIEDPRAGGHIATCRLGAGQAIATSSIRIGRRATADGPVHHLVDPRTGLPGGVGLAAVTVAGPDPAWTEIWSKALFLAGAGSIAQEARSRGLAAWWVDEEGTISMTPAARASTTWVRAESSRLGG
jgi:thiamine biosynthesis lipoprotein